MHTILPSRDIHSMMKLCIPQLQETARVVRGLPRVHAGGARARGPSSSGEDEHDDSGDNAGEDAASLQRLLATEREAEEFVAVIRGMPCTCRARVRVLY